MLEVGLQFTEGAIRKGENYIIYTIAEIGDNYINLSWSGGTRTDYPRKNAEANLRSGYWVPIPGPDVLINKQLTDEIRHILDLYENNIFSPSTNYAILDKKVKTDIRIIYKKLLELKEVFETL